MTETSYDRYKRALEEIADGVDDPAALAAEALRVRKSEPNLEKRAATAAKQAEVQARREAYRRRCLELYNEWLGAGRPHIAPYARAHGMKPTTMLNNLRRAERDLRLPWTQQRLHWEREPEAGFPTPEESEKYADGVYRGSGQEP